jgi:hypothetical protein
MQALRTIKEIKPELIRGLEEVETNRALGYYRIMILKNYKIWLVGELNQLELGVISEELFKLPVAKLNDFYEVMNRNDTFTARKMMYDSLSDEQIMKIKDRLLKVKVLRGERFQKSYLKEFNEAEIRNLLVRNVELEDLIKEVNKNFYKERNKLGVSEPVLEYKFLKLPRGFDMRTAPNISKNFTRMDVHLRQVQDMVEEIIGSRAIQENGYL